MNRRTRLTAAALALGLAGLTAACSSSTPTAATTPASSSSSSAPAISGTVTVFAASSLQKTFTSLATTFEKAHPGVTVKFSFGGSDTLAAQITQGAPADVFASANTATMQTVQKAGDTTGTPTVFVKNTLEIAVAPGDPKGIKTLADLTKSGIKVALCAKTVPCGSAAVKALAAAKVSLTPVTYETEVTGALAKVELGEVDAALVYHSDILGADGKVDGVVFSTASDAVNSYPIDVLKGSTNPTAAAAFEAFILTSASEQVLLAAGFQAP
ncbi:molybdate ABC transporter substrate-binding protein [Actinospica durhamensis]|uniref:Molybdate ABC transporter substrate-binding protein n=1 Tax=Actinospica durhamensis TaxID=1508375 RepID=A0A941ENE9_9ACTN|nr:molybdate ABC transporter substrate-binding protein [Actinospica durhamensis]MBR7833662.1 molybdate ABC transporter substrate-binding protein [Actinospica durhamensis]